MRQRLRFKRSDCAERNQKTEAKVERDRQAHEEAKEGEEEAKKEKKDSVIS